MKKKRVGPSEKHSETRSKINLKLSKLGYIKNSTEKEFNHRAVVIQASETQSRILVNKTETTAIYLNKQLTLP